MKHYWFNDFEELMTITDSLIAKFDLKCICGRPFKIVEGIRMYAYDWYEHEDGILIKSDNKRYWVYIICPHCEYQIALWKLYNKIRFPEFDSTVYNIIKFLINDNKIESTLDIYRLLIDNHINCFINTGIDFFRVTTIPSYRIRSGIDVKRKTQHYTEKVCVPILKQKELIILLLYYIPNIQKVVCEHVVINDEGIFINGKKVWSDV